MPDLNFAVEGAAPEPFAASPMLVFKLRVTQAATAAIPAVPVRNVALQCQVRIEPARRRYDAGSQSRLRELFGDPQFWDRTLKSMLWTHASTVVPAFTGETVADLPVPCTYDFNVAATKYFYSLEDGEVPLCLLFSGTVFYAGEGGGVRVAPIPWSKEASYRLPVRVWKEMMERYYPNSAWLCLRRDVFDRLYRYKSEREIPTWEEALESLLPPAPEEGAR
ncbi:MAG TPA: DUF6084 family protein [Gemmataceae bacterium]